MSTSTIERRFYFSSNSNNRRSEIPNKMSLSPQNSVNLSDTDQKVEKEKKKLKKATSLSVPGQIVRRLSGTDLKPDIDLLINSRRSSSSSYEVSSERTGKPFSEYGLQVNVIIGKSIGTQKICRFFCVLYFCSYSQLFLKHHYNFNINQWIYYNKKY